MAMAEGVRQMDRLDALGHISPSDEDDVDPKKDKNPDSAKNENLDSRNSGIRTTSSESDHTSQVEICGGYMIYFIYWHTFGFSELLARSACPRQITSGSSPPGSFCFYKEGAKRDEVPRATWERVE